MEKYKSLLINIGLFTLNTLATKVVTFLLVPFFTYYFSTSEYGISDIGTSIINVLVPVLTLAANDAVIRFIVDDPKNSEKYVSIGFAITLFGCFVMAVLLPLLDLSFFGGLGHYKGLYLLYFAGVAFQIYFGYVARGRNLIKLITCISVISSLVTVVTAIISVKFCFLRVEGYFLSMIFGNGVAILLYLTWGKLYTQLHIPFSKANIHYLKKMMVFAIPTIPNLVFWWMGTSINRFFITSMMGVGASGIFAAVNKIPSLMNILSNTFWQAWSLSAFKEYRKEGIKSFFSTVFCVFRAFMAMCGSAIILVTPWLAKFLLQGEFFSSWPLVTVLVLAFYFSVLSGFYETIFTTSMKTKGIFISTGIASIVIIVFTWLLVPMLGLLGAALAMLSGNFVMFVIRVFQTQSIMSVQINWVIEIASIILLVAQVVVMYMQTSQYMTFSLVIFLIICVMKLIDVWPFLKLTLGKIAPSSHNW